MHSSHRRENQHVPLGNSWIRKITIDIKKKRLRKGIKYLINNMKQEHAFQFEDDFVSCFIHRLQNLRKKIKNKKIKKWKEA
jgi:hypothetical protein